jgi:competence protein ComFC
MHELDIKLHKLINHVLKARDFILDLIFPIECFNCRQEGTWLCTDCSKKLEFNRSQYCLECKTENKNGQFCHHCQKNYFLDGVLIAGNYDNILLNKLIKMCKYHFIKNIATILGMYLSTFLQNRKINEILFNQYQQDQTINSNDTENILIIPVPLHKKRLRWRGFNQSTEMAKIISKELNYKIDNNNLVRVKNNQAQVKLNEKQRRENLKNCFSWFGESLQGKNIILIDDVVTTGSTLNECAKILKQSGANKIWGLVVMKG